jgi:BMFP domain-containing protein YqiC
VAHLEGRLAEQSEMFVDLRTGLSNLAGRVDQLEQSMNRRFDQVDARFVQMEARLVQIDARSDTRFAQIDRRFLQIDDRFTQVDGHILQVAARVDRLGDDVATHFRWIVGVQITTAMTVIAALIGALAVR